MPSSSANIIHRRRVGRYETLFRIASGGMAEVFAGRVRGEAGFEKLVAIKRMLPTVADDEEFVQMFLDEGRIAANINHPNVVSTLDLGRDDAGGLFLIMDLVVGVTLSGLLKNTSRSKVPIPIHIATELLAQAAEGLHAAHTAVTPMGDPLQIVHRDVSPQNILVGLDGRVRITDFGVARAMQRITHTTGDRFKGKFGYSSPEQLKGEALDCRADIFCLGIVAWETLAYRRLFRGDTPAATVTQILTREPQDVRAYRAKVPEPLAMLVSQCLECDPDARPKSAHDLALKLRETMREHGGRPEVERMRDFVAEHGGETLSTLHQNIRSSLSFEGQGLESVELMEPDAGQRDSAPPDFQGAEPDTCVDSGSTTMASPLVAYLPERTTVEQQHIEAFDEYEGRKAALLGGAQVGQENSGVVSVDSVVGLGRDRATLGRRVALGLGVVLFVVLLLAFLLDQQSPSPHIEEAVAEPVAEPADEAAPEVELPEEEPEETVAGPEPQEAAPIAMDVPDETRPVRRQRRRPSQAVSMMAAGRSMIGLLRSDRLEDEFRGM